jgi:CRP/FNR family transcriptional regulator
MKEVLTNTICATCNFRSLLFEKLTAEEFELLNRHRTFKDFKKGEKIVEEGQLVDTFLYLKTGLVKLSKYTSNKKNHIISITKPKTFIGLLTVFSEQYFQYTITDIEPSSICFIEINTFKTLIGYNGAFALDVLGKICTVSDEIIKNRINICSKQLRGRIAYLLVYFAKDIYNNNKFNLPITRRELGELIDMSTENVIRILSEFRKDNLLNIQGNQIEVVNFEMLKRISKFG